MIQRRAPEDPRSDADFADIMRRLGATSPATACPERELPHLTRACCQDLLDRGVLREAAPGTFYLYEQAISASVISPPPRAFPAPSLALRLFFWLLVILVPVIIIQFAQK